MLTSNKTHLFLLILLLCLAEIAHAQTYCDTTLAGRKITGIVVVGNNKTRSSTILREMAHQKGDSLIITELEADRKRIQNLNLFNRVLIVCEPLDDGVFIRVAVTEQWYLIPYPILFLNDKDWGKISWGAGVSYNNFRGRAESIAFSFWLGYDPAVHLDYYNPWIAGRLNLFTGIGFSYSREMNKHFETQQESVQEIQRTVRWYIGKRIGLFMRITMDMSYRELTLDPPVEGQTLSPDGRDRLPALGLYFSWDKRDLKEYPHKGWTISLGAKQTGWSSLDANYFRYAADLRGYIPLFQSTTLALRTAASLSSGKIPIYERAFIGYGERIRGRFFDVFEGENLAVANIAFRFPILPIRYFSLWDMVELSNLKFGISGGLFYDTGIVWYQKDPFTLSGSIYGYGFGLHLHLPYINVLRLEMAFNARGDTQFIADLDVDI